MKKILVLAYAISPTKGSEYSVAWNYVTNMSIENELVVLYGMSGDHMGEVDEIEQLNANNPIKNVKFVPVLPNKLANLFNSLNKKNVFVYTFYFAYTVWHKQVYKVAKELIQHEDFDLIHFVGPIGYREPGYLWKLPLPYIWGPIGGTNNLSPQLLPALNLQGIAKLGFRTIANTIQLHFKHRIKKAIKRCDVLLTATMENKYVVDRIFKVNSIYLPENGITIAIKPKKRKTDTNKIILVWIGSIDERKALITLLKALVLVKDINKVELHVVGDGPLKSKMEIYAKNNKISDSIIWHGKVTREKVFDILINADLHIITSLTEANTTIIWEAMSVGVPTMTLDHCGMHDTICDSCGIKIPIVSYKQVLRELATKIDMLCHNPDKIKKLSEGTVECAEKYTWDKRVDFFNEMYNIAVENFKLRRK
ncbi:MAG: glycosyltransferase family 4 protein [Paludibacteraceae bacterium]